MRFLCWWMPILVALLPSVCYSADKPEWKPPTDEDYKEDFRKFRKHESGQVQVSLLMNVLERYELYDEVEFAQRDFDAKFARVRQILLKFDMIDERKIVQELGPQPKGEDSLRVKYAIPRIDPTWKHYRWKYFWKYTAAFICGCTKRDSKAWCRHLEFLEANVDHTNSEQLPKNALYYAHQLYDDFQKDVQFEQARQQVEANFARFQHKIVNRIERFFGMLLSVLKLEGNGGARVDPSNIKKYLEKLSLWSTKSEKAWLDLLRRLIDGPPEQNFDRNVEIPQELRLFVDDRSDQKIIVELTYFVKILANKYGIVLGGATNRPWNESIFLSKVYLMILWDMKLYKLESGTSDPRPFTANCVYQCLGYGIATGGTIASLGLLFNKLAYGQFFPDCPTQVTTLPWNTTNTPLVITQEPSGWTNWQVVALVVVVAIIMSAIGLTLVYYRYFQATGTAHLNISGKDTAGTTTTTGSTTST